MRDPRPMLRDAPVASATFPVKLPITSPYLKVRNGLDNYATLVAMKRQIGRCKPMRTNPQTSIHEN